MKFAKYDLNFADNANEGTTPDAEFVSGIFYIDETSIVGNFFGNPGNTDLSAWNLVEISKDELLSLAESKGLDLSFDESGAAFITPPTTTPTA